MDHYRKIALPKELEAYRNEIEKQVKPFIRITGNKGDTSLLQSKFGGAPYLPKTMDHPKDESGRAMKLLAQINFEEVPTLQSFPPKGMLQFYLSIDDDGYGLDFDNPTKQKNYRIMYHPEILTDDDLLVTDFSYMDDFDEDYFPLEETALSFEQDYETVSVADYRFENVDIDLEQVVGEGEDGEITLWEVYAEELSNEGHKMGGYAFFTQVDPREDEKKYRNHTITLLQIDTDDDLDIMWGDAGVANFFIKEEDLLKLDFSNVLYNWDCH
ncbi:YwqG family protein [Bacillus sp. CECT 9360]|uniref:YwqG family protein n=1 Tax=Bacillus sp. CECT 9360 TaxID=2845821 RepID=UPI001E5A817F|nr:YwqG family protein [Bacillus sp. CECT 9360]CAH0346042.1 putative protein YwqG [Bacillus sp. CECT 9360]